MVGTASLVGRDTVLGLLARAVAATADRRPGLMLVTGEPGIGKTALLAEATRRAAADGARVLWGQCWDGDGAPPYWPWIQVLRADGDRLTLAGDPGDAGPTGRFELFDTVVRRLAELAEAEPLVIVLDDLHWADDGSLALLEFAARHLHGTRVLLLGAYRDLDATPALRRVAGLAEILPLAGLDRDGVAAVMADVTGDNPTGELAAELRDRTNGNPLFVREMTRLLVARGLPDAGHPLPVVPDSVGETLRRRLARLSQECVRMLSAASVAGRRFRLDVVRMLLPATPDGLHDLLAEAARAQVLRAGPPDAYAFSHELFRDTLYADLSPVERTRLHLGCATALEALADGGAPVHAAEVAAHFLAAGRSGPGRSGRSGGELVVPGRPGGPRPARRRRRPPVLPAGAGRAGHRRRLRRAPRRGAPRSRRRVEPGR